MRVLFLSLILPFALGCTAQLRVQSEPAGMDKQISLDRLTEDFFDVTPVLVTNVTAQEVRLLPRLENEGKPRDWTFAIYSRRSNRAPYPLSGRIRYPSQAPTLEPGESITLYVKLDPGGALGGGGARLQFVDANTGKNIGKDFNLKVGIEKRPVATGERPVVRTNLASNRPPATNLGLYPNPARERFYVDTPPGVRLGRVDVTNALGKRLLRFDGSARQDGYEIENLPDGLYLISIYNDRGKKLKTLRLLHRRFGA